MIDAIRGMEVEPVRISGLVALVRVKSHLEKGNFLAVFLADMDAKNVDDVITDLDEALAA
ncbi:MAG: hypothetical protein AUI84_07045 [Delftia sp. 13_1_40CM_3_66_6]|nr:MAG: hypothetical protein AUI84_07045 [Delftia sp. 13_1_40CM_3_66_6]